MNIELAKQPEVREIAISFAKAVEKIIVVDYDEKYNNFIKNNTPTLYNARRVIPEKNPRSFILLTDSEGKTIHQGGSHFNTEHIIMRYKGYEYYSPAYGKVVYNRLE